MRPILFALVVAFGLVAAPAAEARTEKTLAYPRAEAWAAAVRFIRVDAHLKVTEKDADAGYVLFELHEENKTFRGSLELVDVTEDGRHAVRFVLQIEDRPAWVEIELMSKLETKLRVEIGEPEPPPSPKADPDPPKSDKPDDKPKGDKCDKSADRAKPDDKPHDDGPPISATP